MSDEEEILILANPEEEDEYDFENMKLDLDHPVAYRGPIDNP